MHAGVCVMSGLAEKEYPSFSLFGASEIWRIFIFRFSGPPRYGGSLSFAFRGLRKGIQPALARAHRKGIIDLRTRVPFGVGQGRRDEKQSHERTTGRRAATHTAPTGGA